MTTVSHPNSDREALSALFDGELGGDAARFALKRLDHDQGWRATCERWSLVGDVLRAQGQALLPAGFPARLRAAAGARASAPPVTVKAMPRWAKWGGVGLAASVAAVSLFLARQTAEVESVGVPDAPVVATAPAPAPAKPAPVRVVPPDSGVPEPAGHGAAQLASAGLVAAEVSRQGAQRSRAARHAPAKIRQRNQPIETAVEASVPPTAVATAPLLARPMAPAPFAGNAVRPWPRAVLPQLSGNGALTTDFGATSPSFYPFEPRLPDSANDASVDRSAQDAPSP